MRGINRLIEGLQAGDPTAMWVLVLVVVGTIVIVGITTVIRKRREREGRP